MPDRHKIKPKAVRMPDGLLAWYEKHAAVIGKTVNGALVGALEEYRSRREGGSTTLAVKAGRDSTTTEAEQPESATAKCSHRRLRLSKGVCPDCHEWAVKK